MKMNLVAKATLIMLALLFTGMDARAQLTDVPRIISYQGKIDNASGQPIADGKHTVTVSLYRDEDGKHKVWTSTEQVDVKGGIMNLQLGKTKALPNSNAMSGPLYVGVSLNGTVEMRPLTMLTAAPYAINIPDKSVTMEKLSDEVTSKITGFKSNQDQQSWTLLGTGNISGGTSDFLGGGTNNSITPFNAGAGNKNTLTGGETNLIDSTTNHNFIGGGRTNVIIASSASSAIGGGDSNTIQGAQGAFIGGGDSNRITGRTATIGGGAFNLATGKGAFIGGGQAESAAILVSNNRANGQNTVVGGGSLNEANADYSTITGGELNITTGTHSFIGGGGNTVGGVGNSTTKQYSSIVGGKSNSVETEFSSIGGGEDNSISTNGTYSAGLHHNTIGGGQLNAIVNDNGSRSAHHSTIAGGDSNSISGLSEHATIGGGGWNQINFRLGGTTKNDYGTIAGGSYNFVENSWGVISGGFQNHTKGDYSKRLSTIAGGSGNTTDGLVSTIVGGEKNITNQYGQLVGCFFNEARVLTVPITGNPNVTQTNTYNEPLFILGNGKLTLKRNAFEVSFNGHSIVHDRNGTGSSVVGGRASIIGATYRDNVIYAWGDVQAMHIEYSGPFPVKLIVNCDFGVDSVMQTAVGTYTVYLNVDDAWGANASLSCGAITTSPVGPVCGLTSSPGRLYGTNNQQFDVKTCYAPNSTVQNNDFMFHVTARPNNPNAPKY